MGEKIRDGLLSFMEKVSPEKNLHVAGKTSGISTIS
jgi:hypothetical protein